MVSFSFSLVSVWNVICVSREHCSGLSEHLSNTFL